VLGGFFADWRDAFAASSLRPVLSTPAAIEAWAAACPAAPSALQVDSGMNRLGLSATEAEALAARPDLVRRAGIGLVMSHLACADEPAHPQNAAQLQRFRALRALYPALPASFANSAGLHLGADFRFDLVRPGVALYGGAFSDAHPPLEPVVTATARVIQIRDAVPGDGIGYGAALRLAKPARIAILAAGYADGYLRAAGSRDGRPGADVWADGQRLPVLGRVSMDLIAADATDAPTLREGDAVELFGPHMPLDAVARAAGTIGYELLTGLSRRAARHIIPATGSA
jgi:alanine racemase